MRTRVHQKTHLKISNYYSLLRYLTGFGIARGLLVVSPIFLANLLPKQVYGMLEFSQSISAIVAIFISMGSASLVPLIKISKIETASWDSVLLHQLVCSTILVIAGFILINFDAVKPVIGLTCLCTSALLLQGFWSVVLKTKGHAEFSLLLDAGFWIFLMLVAFLVSFFSLLSHDLNITIWKDLAVYNALLIGVTGRYVLDIRLGEAMKGYLMTLRSSLPLMMSSIMTALVSTAGRWGIGLISTLTLTADYSILYRVASLSIVIHQLTLVRLFPRLFDATYEKLDKMLANILCLVGLSILIFWMFIDKVAWIFGPAFVAEFSNHRLDTGMIIVQSILWSAIALNETVCLRSQIAGVLAKMGGLYFLLVLPALFFCLYGRENSLIVFIVAHSILMLGYFFVQIFVISRHRIYILRTWRTALGLYFLLCVLIWFHS